VRAFNFGISDEDVPAIEFTHYPKLTLWSSAHHDMQPEFVRDDALELVKGNDKDGKLTDTSKVEADLVTEKYTCSLKRLSDVIRDEEKAGHLPAGCPLDMLKVDVEGAEFQVLKGVDEEHWNRVQQVVVEVHDIDGKLEQMCQFLRDRGFKVEVEHGAPPSFLVFRHLGVDTQVKFDKSVMANIYAKRETVLGA